MSNRNFDSSVIHQRLQNQVFARNAHAARLAGSPLISNPQNSDGNASRMGTYHMGSQTEYGKGLVGGVVTTNLGGVFGLQN